MRTRTIGIFLVAALFNIAAWAQSVPGTAPPPTKLTAPGGERPGSPQEPPQKQLPGAKASPAILAAPGAGSVEGFVYWDAKAISHVPGSSCGGLAVTVSVGRSSGGPLTAYTPMASVSNAFKYVGQVKEFMVGGKVNVYDVCTYGYGRVPVGPDLQVTLSVTQPSAFSPYAAPQIAILGPIKIINGQCNMLPRIANPTSSDLTAHWGSCQNMAYDVNFVLQPAAQVLGSASGGSGSTPEISGKPTGMLSSAPNQGMLANGGTPNSQPGGAGGLLGNQAATPAQGEGNITQSAPQQAASHLLTNADVIKMVKAGVPQSTIVSSIQSSPAQFDLSPKGLGSLHRAGVNQAVLGTMQAGNGNTGGSASAPAGAGSAAAGKPAAIDPALLAKLGPAQVGPRIKNQRAARFNAAAIAVLQQQTSAANRELSQMKLSLRPQAGAPAGQSQLMSAGGSSGPGNASQAVLAQPPNVVPSVQPQGGTGGGGTGGPTSNLASINQLHYFNGAALACVNDPTFRIISVSGNAGPATFTPIDQYNLYTITGCSFGNPGANEKVSIYGAGSFQGNFTIKFWSDNSIAISLDESITGYPDLSNITLVVQRSDGQQAQKPGYRFYAFRQVVPLSAIPSSWTQLLSLTTGFKTLSPQYSSPASSLPGPGPSTATSSVSRFYDGAKFDPTGQSDYYDFSKLSSGWTTDSFQVNTYGASCPYVITYKQSFGTWHWDWDRTNPNNIRVWPSTTTCSGVLPPAPWVNYQNLTASYYSLQVWVIGPRGIDPFTGQPGP